MSALLSPSTPSCTSRMRLRSVAKFPGASFGNIKSTLQRLPRRYAAPADGRTPGSSRSRTAAPARVGSGQTVLAEVRSRPRSAAPAAASPSRSSPTSQPPRTPTPSSASSTSSCGAASPLSTRCSASQRAWKPSLLLTSVTAETSYVTAPRHSHAQMRLQQLAPQQNLRKLLLELHDLVDARRARDRTRLRLLCAHASL